MIRNFIIHAVTTLFIIWYWSNSDSSSKDEFFYLYLIGSQAALFFLLHKISQLSAELMSLKEPKDE